MTSTRRDVFIAGAARTPTGKFSGAFESVPATTLGATAIKGALRRADLEAEAVEYTVMGNMLSAGLGQTPARQAAIEADIPASSSAMTINKACASGMQSVIVAAQAIQLDEADVVAAGGMENMTRSPHLLMNSRTGQRMGDAKLIDSLIHDGLWCPFENRHMGGSAEAIAEKYEIERADQDKFAEQSHKLASAANESGLFEAETEPVKVETRRGSNIISADEGPRRDISFDALSALRPAFPPGQKVTAGNASQISDGAAAVILKSGQAAKAGPDPMARITGYAHAANDPGMLFDAPRLAVTRLLEKTGERLADFDQIEVNEAFAAQVLANGKALDWDWDRVNPTGGGIALGHPIGASGARILVTLLHGLVRTGGRKGMAVICHAGGGAVAMSVEMA